MITNIMGEDRSLKSNVNATDKITDILLSLNSDEGSKIIWILVEGDDDCKIYPKFFDETKARVEFVNGGIIELERALTTLMNKSKQVIGIRDADFLHLEKNYPSIDNLFYTDYHDIEMTMLYFDDVINNLFTEVKIKNNAKSIRDNAMDAASYIAYIRWYNENKRCKIDFKTIGYNEDIFDINDCAIAVNIQKLLNKLNLCSKHKTRELIKRDIDTFIENKKTLDLFNLCNGHDVSKMMTLLTKSVINTNFSYDKFTSLLRASFNIQHFTKTQLYLNIRNWQDQNGYAILKNVA